MQIKETGLAGLLLIEPERFRDERGFFLESFQHDRYRTAGIADTFVQDNHSRSSRGVLRGLHFQVKHPQAQIVTVMHGRIFDVAVDLRRQSPTFGQWFGVELSDDRRCQVYMAPGFAHGYYVLSDVADLHYKVSRYYESSDEGGLLWNDPDVGIRWPVETPLISERDSTYPKLRELTPTNLPRNPSAENFKIWDGIYATFAETGADNSAFNGGVWIEKLTARVEQARAQSQGPAAIAPIAETRDSALPVIAAAIARRDKPLRILDFGGGTAQSYFPLLQMLPSDQPLEFMVVENEAVCRIGRNLLAGDTRVSFHTEISLQDKFDIVHFGSSLHYIDDWLTALERILKSNPAFLLFADLPAADNETFVTVQNYYGKRIPVRFWNVREFIALVEKFGYELVFKARFRGAYRNSTDDLPTHHFDQEHRLIYSSQLIFRLIKSSE